MQRKFLFIFLILIGLDGFSQRVIDAPFGKGLYNVIAADSSWSMNMQLRIQTLFWGSSDFSDSLGRHNSNSQFLIRRSRLKFNGFAFSPKLKYKFELGLSNQDLGKVNSSTNYAPRMILDAVVEWNFYNNFVLWAGQTKLAGNRDRVISSGNMQLVDRSMLNSNFNIDRDIGMQLRHHFYIKRILFKEVFSISQGEGRNVVQNNLGGFQYTSRFEILPFGKFTGNGDYKGADIAREPNPKLALGVTYDLNDRAVKTKSNQGSYMIDLSGDNSDGYFHSDISTIFADAMFKYRGLSIMGEYVYRTADHVDHLSSDSTSSATVQVGNGLNLQAGFLFKNNWELAGRFTQVNLGRGVDASTQKQYTLGVSKYVVGHALKVQTDVSYLSTKGIDIGNLLCRLQVEIKF